jgi:hypothetical protein
MHHPSHAHPGVLQDPPPPRREAAQDPWRVQTLTWPGSVGLAPPAVYFSPVWNPRGGEGCNESAQGNDGWEGGKDCSGSRKAVTSGAFPGNCASVPCNAGRGTAGAMEYSIAP